MSNQVKTKLNKINEGTGLKTIKDVFGMRMALSVFTASTIFMFLSMTVVIQIAAGVN